MASWRFFLNNIEVEEPIGWDAIEFTAKRTDEHGIDQPFSTEITFYGKGAKLIKSLYETQFINAEITLQIVSDVYVNGVAWEFNGFVNMALYSEKNVCDTDSWEVTVGIIDDNFREKFKSRMGVDIDIYSTRDLDGNTIPQPIFDETRLHTQEVYLVAFAQSIKAKYPIQPWGSIFWTNANGWILEDFAVVIPAFFNSNDFKGPFGSAFDPEQVKWHPSKGVCFKNNARFVRTIDFKFTISGAFQWVVPNGDIGETANILLSLQVINGDAPNGGDETQRYYFGGSAINTFNSGVVTQYNLSGNQVVTLQPEDRVLIFLQWGGGGNIQVGGVVPQPPSIGREMNIWVDDCCLTVTEKNSAEYASFAETMLAENFLKRLIRIITGNDNGLISDTFKESTGCYWNYALTNGLKIRRAKTALAAQNNCDPLEEAPQTNFKVSFNDLFDGLNAIFCLGWAFEWVNGSWKVRIETVDYFYKNQIEFTAINVGEVTQAAKTDALANEFRIGYDETWKNIQAAGIWAIHTDRNYYVNNRAMAEGTTKKVELLSNIIAEGYAIEFSRRMWFFQDDSGSSDRPNDYELFIIWLNRNALIINDIEDSEYKLPPSYNESGTVTLPSGTVSMSSGRLPYQLSEVNNLYNIYISPARNACRWWKVLGMHTYGMTNPRLQFQSGEYQTLYQATVDGTIEDIDCIEVNNGNIAENSDIYVNALALDYREYLFRPIEISFNYPQSLCDFINLAENNPYGKVKLTSGSLSVSGYIQDIANKPEDNNGGTTSFVLLASNIAEPEPPQPPQDGPYNEAYNQEFL